MLANRIHRFGGPEVIEFEEIVQPEPSFGEVLVRVRSAGVGPWDSLIRRGGSALGHSLPLTLGSDLSGTIASVGPGVSSFEIGDEVYGVTNSLFIGAYAEFAVASASKVAARPKSLSFAEAASVPVIAITAYQMLFEHAQLRSDHTVLILGATGNVGAFATQLASAHGATVIGATPSREHERALELGANHVIETRDGGLRRWSGKVDVVIDTVGSDLQRDALATLKPGGIFVSAVAQPDPSLLKEAAVRGVFFYVDVKTADLAHVARSLDQGVLKARVGEILHLRQARTAHEMLDGLLPRPGGKIVLEV
ncbi:MAG: NADP-dependent oxidoreductase [Variovorax sp.]|nr:MAG: NADP-dependent oxidoreductase [Variovorax sp.]